jgi:hypothetical protein
MSYVAAIAAAPAGQDQGRLSFFRAPYTFLCGMVSSYFILACCSLYWLTAGAGWLVGKVLPRSRIERAPLGWLVVSTAVMAGATQTIPGFFPNYTNSIEIVCELVLWLSIGLFARSYLIYAEYPDTFEGLKQSIASRALDRWISGLLHHPIDAIFTRIWVGNSIAMIPLTVLLILPSTINYFVLAAYGVALLLIQFPHDLADHVNIHTRIFQPKLGASGRVKTLLKALQFYFENVLALLLARAPHYYRVQHVYVHHVEDNGLLDSQTTAPCDRTSFFDFSRHAFKQGVDLVTGISIYRYLRTKGKMRQVRDLARGLAIWWGLIIVLGLFNPVAAGIVFISRFLGGNMQSLVAFWQHGLVDPDDIQDSHGNCTDYVGHDHGNLGNDYHAEHHLKPGRHWASYYEEYARVAKSEGGHPAVVMHKEVFSPLAFVAALWRKDYGTIAKYAHLGGVAEGDTQTLTEIVEQRTRPIAGTERSGLSARVDAVTGRMMAMALPTSFRV